MRNDLALKPKRLVVKIGSAAITSSQGGLDLPSLEKICRDLVQIEKAGYEVVLVSSGAINTGRQFLKNKKDASGISFLQAASAVGQPLLMAAYQSELARSDIHSAQVLLTHDDLKHRTRQFNTRNVIMELLQQKIIPVLNENDSVSFEEITVGDNDQLAAMVALLVDADLLLILTGPDGLYDRDPALPEAEHFPVIQYEDDLKNISTLGKSAVGRGGMTSKLAAIKKVTPLGIEVLLGSYREDRPICRLLENKCGTLFCAKKIPKNQRRKAWLFTTVKSKSHIVVDKGAYEALCKNGSLLPIGIKKVEGTFKRGDVVAINFQGRMFAAGVSEYDFREVSKLAGKKSSDIESVLGSCPSNVVIHRDNMFIKDKL